MRASSSGQPRRSISATLSAPPWEHHDAGSPGASAANASSERRHDAPSTCAVVSPPGTHVEAPGAERGVLLGVRRGVLGHGQARPLAQVVLAQPRVELEGQPGRARDVLGGLPGPGEVGATTDRPAEAPATHGATAAACGVPGVVELDVGVALRPALGVPGGLRRAGAGPGARRVRSTGARRSAGRDVGRQRRSTGQSRQSRSRA